MKQVNMHRCRIAGVVLLVVSIVLWAVIEFQIIRPALTPGADGTFGEMYGPVSQLRDVLYALCGAAALAGGLIAGRVGMLTAESRPLLSTSSRR